MMLESFLLQIRNSIMFEAIKQQIGQGNIDYVQFTQLTSSPNVFYQVNNQLGINRLARLAKHVPDEQCAIDFMNLNRLGSDLNWRKL